MLARKNILFILNLIHLNDYGRKVIGNVGASFGFTSDWFEITYYHFFALYFLISRVSSLMFPI